jgi:hypothetical protein
LQHELKVAVADWEHQVPAHCPQDNLSRELAAFEGQTRPKLRQPPSHHALAWPRLRQTAKMQQNRRASLDLLHRRMLLAT